MTVKKEDHRVQAGTTGATGATGAIGAYGGGGSGGESRSNWGDWAGATGATGAASAAHDNRSRERLLADFVAEMKIYFERQHNALAALKTKFQAINDQVSALHNSPKTITPEQHQKLLDGILVGVAAFSDDLDTFAAVHPLAPPSIP